MRDYLSFSYDSVISSLSEGFGKCGGDRLDTVREHDRFVEIRDPFVNV